MNGARIDEIRQRVGGPLLPFSKAVQREMVKTLPADQLMTLLMIRIEDIENLLAHIEAQEKLMEQMADALILISNTASWKPGEVSFAIGVKVSAVANQVLDPYRQWKEEHNADDTK